MKMSRIATLAGFAAVMLLVDGLQADDGPAFKPFASKAGRFSVLLPGDPKEQVTTREVDSAKLELHAFVVETNDGTAYIVGYNDFPTGSDATATPDTEKVLNGARDSAATNWHGKLERESKISIDGFPGRELRIKVEGGAFDLRIYLVKNRLYQILVGGSDVPPATVKKYLDSFKLTKE